MESEFELLVDPDNAPPRSRLFLAVPRFAVGQYIKDEMRKFSCLEYCKIDLIQSKGIAFAKFSKASAALRALEKINETSLVAGYKVTCVLAQPKLKKSQADWSESLMTLKNCLSLHQPKGHMPSFSLSSLFTGGLVSENSLCGFSSDPSFQANQIWEEDFRNMFTSHLSMGCTATSGPEFMPPSGFDRTIPGLLQDRILDSLLKADNKTLAISVSPLHSKQRLFVIVFKGVSQEMLAKLFRRIPGMEYCDLKKDKWSGLSKGYAYVNYSTHEAALAAIRQFSGIEFPPDSGNHLKVMFAKLLGVDKKSTHQPGLTAQPQRELFFDSFGYVEEGHVVYTSLTRPLPEYTINHLFSRFGKVQFVILNSADNRYGMVKFYNAKAAYDALSLDGCMVLGEKLSVHHDISGHEELTAAFQST